VKGYEGDGAAFVGATQMGGCGDTDMRWCHVAGPNKGVHRASVILRSLVSHHGTGCKTVDDVQKNVGKTMQPNYKLLISSRNIPRYSPESIRNLYFF